MPVELPSPPPDSPFRLDHDGQGRPRLIWQSRIGRAGCVTAGFGFVLYSLLWSLADEVDETPLGPPVDGQVAVGETRHPYHAEVEAVAVPVECALVEVGAGIGEPVVATGAPPRAGRFGCGLYP